MNKKAFTLVELLAVIIIIGVISVITIPKIQQTLEKTKKDIVKTSANGYIRTIEEYLLNEKMNLKKTNLNGTYNINSDGVLYNSDQEYNIQIKGKKPINGTLTYNKNELVSGCLTIDKYKVMFERGELNNIIKGTCNYAKLPTRDEVLPTLASEYIESIESLELTQSGIYSVPTLNNQTSYANEKPSDGWVSIVYDATNGNWAWKYSLKYRENEVVSYNSANQTKSTQLMQQPEVVLIAGTNAKTAGDEIAISNEHFYILENTGTKIIALAKSNLNVGYYKSTNLTEGIQGEANTAYGVPFSRIEYWINTEATESPYVLSQYRYNNYDMGNVYDPDNYAGEPGENDYSLAYYILNYVDYLNGQHPSLNVTGRLLKQDEYATYKVNYQTILELQQFWLGTATTTILNNARRGLIYTKDLSSTTFSYSERNAYHGVRPVIEISTSNF